MVTVKRGDGTTMTIQEGHWESLQKFQAAKTSDPTQIYKEVKAEQKKEDKPKSKKS